MIKQSWEGIGSHINPSSMEEIEHILRRKTKKVTDSFLLASVTGLIVFPVFFAAACYAMLSCWDEVFFRFNNMFLCAYAGIKFYNSITAFYRIRFVGPNLPLKDWLKRWVNYKQKFGNSRNLASILFIPLFITSLYLSAYQLITKESISEILDHPTFTISFLTAFITSRTLAIFINRRKKVKQLQYLQDLYNEM